MSKITDRTLITSTINDSNALILAHSHISTNALVSVQDYIFPGISYKNLLRRPLDQCHHYQSIANYGNKMSLKIIMEYLYDLSPDVKIITLVNCAPGEYINVLAPAFPHFLFECYDSRDYLCDADYFPNISIIHSALTLDRVQCFDSTKRVLICDIVNEVELPSVKMKIYADLFNTSKFVSALLPFCIQVYQDCDPTFRYLSGQILLLAYQPSDHYSTALFVNQPNDYCDYDRLEYNEKINYYHQVVRRQVYRNLKLSTDFMKYGDLCYDCVSFADCVTFFLNEYMNESIFVNFRTSARSLGFGGNMIALFMEYSALSTSTCHNPVQLPQDITLDDYMRALRTTSLHIDAKLRPSLTQPINIIQTSLDTSDNIRVVPPVEVDWYLMSSLPSFSTYLPYAFNSPDLREVITLLRNDNNNVVLATLSTRGFVGSIEYGIYMLGKQVDGYKTNTVHDDIDTIIIVRDDTKCMQYTINTKRAVITGFNGETILQVKSSSFVGHPLDAVLYIHQFVIEDINYDKCFNLDGELEHHLYNFGSKKDNYSDRGSAVYGSNIIEILKSRRPEVVSDYENRVNFGRWQTLRSFFSLEDHTTIFNSSSSNVAISAKLNTSVNVIPQYVLRAMYVKEGFQSHTNIAVPVKEITRVIGTSGILHLCKVCGAMWPTRLYSFMCQSFHSSVSRFPCDDKLLSIRTFGYTSRDKKQLGVFVPSCESKSILNSIYDITYTEGYLRLLHELKKLQHGRRFISKHYEFIINEVIYSD